MKKFRKAAALLLSCAMVFGLAGCGEGSKETLTPLENEEGAVSETSQGATGRFMESEIKLPEGVEIIQAMRKLEDGSVQLVGSSFETNTIYILNSKDAGETWESSELSDLNETYLSNIAIAPDGSTAFFGYFDNSEAMSSMTMGLKIAAKDGDVRSVDLQLPKFEGEGLMPFEVQGETTFVTDDTENVEGLETSGTEGVETTIETEATETESGNETIDEIQYETYKGNIDNMVTQAGYAKDGNLIISDLGSQLYTVDTKTGEVSQCFKLDGEAAEYFGIAGNKLLAATLNGIRIFNTTDKTEVEKDTVLDEVIKTNGRSSSVSVGTFPVVFTEGIEENSVVYANHEGIFYHLENGSVSECVVSGELSSLSDTSKGICGVVMADDKNYLVSIMDSNSNTKLLKYTYDKNASAIPEKQIKVYTLEDSNFLRQAVSNFQASHPEVYVNVEVGMSSDSGVTAEDALQALNTDILAGTGPDILILDGMPMDSYMEKGVLGDMKSLLDEIDQTDGLFSNIKKAYENNGNIYCMPVRFKAPIVEGSEEAVLAGNTLENLLNFGKTLKTEGGIGVFPNIGVNGILEELYQADSANWQNEDGSIKEEALKNYLMIAKEMIDLDGYAPEETNDYMYTSEDTEGLDLGTAGSNSMSRLLKIHQISFGSLGSFFDLGNIYGIEKQISGTYGLLNSETTQTFIPSLITGICKGNEEKEEVKEFIKTLFGKECGSAAENGFPVNKAAYEALYQAQAATADTVELQGGVALMTEDGVTVTYSLEPVTESDYKELTEKLESLETPMITDRVIHDLVIEEGVKYLNNQQSLEECTSTILQKVNLYLSE